MNKPIETTSFEFKAKSVSFLVNKYPHLYNKDMRYKVRISHQVPHGEGEGYTITLQAIAEDNTVIGEDKLEFDNKEDLQDFKDDIDKATKAYL